MATRWLGEGDLGGRDALESTGLVLRRFTEKNHCRSITRSLQNLKLARVSSDDILDVAAEVMPFFLS